MIVYANRKGRLISSLSCFSPTNKKREIFSTCFFNSPLGGEFLWYNAPCQDGAGFKALLFSPCFAAYCLGHFFKTRVIFRWKSRQRIVEANFSEPCPFYPFSPATTWGHQIIFDFLRIWWQWKIEDNFFKKCKKCGFSLTTYWEDKYFSWNLALFL